MSICPRCQMEHPAGDGLCPAGTAGNAGGSGPARTLPAEDDPLIGAAIGAWQLCQRIGAGGMGVVYRAKHTALGTDVAIKVLNLEPSPNPSETPLARDARLQEARERFVREAEVAAKLGNNDPSIIKIYHYGHLDDGRPYMVMEFLHGRTLAEWQDAEVLPEGDLRRWLVEVCDALASIHEAGVVHRDLKPENIWIVEEKHRPRFAKIIDFGISKAKGASPLTGVNDLAPGSYRYMAPERWNKQNDDHRSDLWALGVVLYEVFTGKPPYDGELAHCVKQILTDPPPSLAFRKGVTPSARLEKLILDCLAKPVEDRPQSALEIKSRLLDAFGACEEAAKVRDGLLVTLPFAPAALGLRDQPAPPAATTPPGPPAPVLAQEPATATQISALAASRRSGIILLASIATGFVLAGGGYIVWQHRARPPAPLVAPPLPTMTPPPAGVPRAEPGPAAKSVPVPAIMPVTKGETAVSRRRTGSARSRASSQAAPRGDSIPASLQPAPVVAAPALPGKAAPPPPAPAASGPTAPARWPLPEAEPSRPFRKQSPSDRDLITNEKVLIGN